MDKTLTIKIKDSVDLFLYDDIYLTAYFMNTRVRKSFRVDGNFISLIGFIDGYATIGEICDKMRIDHNVEEKETLNIIETLLKKILQRQLPDSKINCHSMKFLNTHGKLTIFPNSWEVNMRGLQRKKN